MGTVHSSESEGSKLSLADRRYRVSQARAAAVVKRRSTRKLGSVALELKNPNDESEAGTSLQFYQNDDVDGDSEEEEGEGKEKGESKEETNPTGNEEELGARKISRQLRQRRLGNFQLTRTENAANATILLTRTQRVLIENCWKRAKKGAAEGGIGARVFHTVLIAQPDIKLLFGLEKVPQGRLKYEGQFRRHAGLLNRALEYIVKNLQYTEKLGHHFQTLGKKHCQMNGGRAFPSHYWDAFLECITQSVLECDGASGGRQHRCRETAMAWRNLISFIVQQMRRGFEDERLLRKRFSASLMGIRGVANNALNAAYNSSGSERTRRAATGRPRPSIVHQHHSHGSLGSLEMLPNQQYSLPISTLSSSSAAAFGVRARASSAISPLALGQQSSKGSIGPTGQESCEEEQFCHLMLHSGDASPSNSSSARSASWCAEVSEGQLRRLQIGDDNKQSRTARSDLNIDNEGGGDVFYTPRMPPRNVEINSPTVECAAIDDDDISPPKPAIAAVQLLLNAASSEGHMLDVRSAPPGILLSRHSFSEFAVNGGGNEGGERMVERMPKECMEKAAAINASQKLLSLAHAHMHSGGKESGDSSPTQQRRLSAL